MKVHLSSPSILYYSILSAIPNPGFRAYRFLLGGPGPESPYHSRGTYTPVLTFVLNSVCAIIDDIAHPVIWESTWHLLPPLPFLPHPLFVPFLIIHNSFFTIIFSKMHPLMK